MHSALALACASHLALQSALTFGGVTVPVHFGAFISTEHEPEQVPLHSAFAFSSQEPEQEPEQVPFTSASHLPSHLPAQAPLVSLPSHLPSQLPPHEPLIAASHLPEQLPAHFMPPEASHLPSHCAEHSPCNLPGSHSTFALPPLADTSHLAEQSPTTSRDAEHFGGSASTVSLSLAPSLAFTSPMILTATLQASSPVL